MNDLFRLDTVVAAVIGGTGALGGAMAEALAGAGGRVAIVGRSAMTTLPALRRSATKMKPGAHEHP